MKYWLIEIHEHGFSQMEINRERNVFYFRNGERYRQNPKNYHEEIVTTPLPIEELKQMYALLKK